MHFWLSLIDNITNEKINIKAASQITKAVMALCLLNIVNKPINAARKAKILFDTLFLTIGLLIEIGKYLDFE